MKLGANSIEVMFEEREGRRRRSKDRIRRIEEKCSEKDCKKKNCRRKSKNLKRNIKKKTHNMRDYAQIKI